MTEKRSEGRGHERNWRAIANVCLSVFFEADSLGLTGLADSAYDLYRNCVKIRGRYDAERQAKDWRPHGVVNDVH